MASRHTLVNGLSVTLSLVKYEWPAFFRWLVISMAGSYSSRVRAMALGVGDLSRLVLTARKAAKLWEQGEYRQAYEMMEGLGDIFEQMLEHNRPLQGKPQDEDEEAVLAQVREAALGEMLLQLGDYARAIPALEFGVRFRREQMAKGKPVTPHVVLRAHRNLALAHKAVGDYDAACRTLEEGFKPFEDLRAELLPKVAKVTGTWMTNKVFRLDHSYTTFYLELADVYLLAGRPRDAERVLAIVEQAIPGLLKRHQGGLTLTWLLAQSRLAQLDGRLGDAGDYVAAIYLIVKQGGPDVKGPLLEILRHVGSVLLAIGEATNAEEVYTAALEVAEENPTYAAHRREVMAELAAAVYANGRHEEAVSRLLDACSQDRIIWEVFSVVSVPQRLRYLARLTRDLDSLLTWVEDDGLSESFGARAYEVLLRRKGASFEIDVAQQEAAFSDRYPELRPSLQQLSALRTRIGQKTLAGAGPEGIEEHESMLAMWRQQRQELEAELVRKIPLRQLTTPLQATIREVAGALPPDSALIELYRYRHGTDPSRYVAFVLGGEDEEAIAFYLGDAGSLDALADDFRNLLAGVIPFPGREQAAARVGDLASRLLPALNAARSRGRRLVIATDGKLSGIPFELLPVTAGPGQALTTARLQIPLGEDLLGRYADISYVTTGRDLCRLKQADQPSTLASPLIVGAPDYNLATQDDAIEAGEAAWHFDDLDGTALEVLEVARLLNVTPLTGQSAIKSAVKNGPAPAVLHLATHSYSFADTSSMPTELQDAIHGIESYALRAGLALAGANTRLRRGTSRADGEDGLLSADDILGMDLQGTELVTLSACETGIGAITAGEGNFGLRRSFLIAGARSLIVSLWKVPDEATAPLMREFYRGLLLGESKTSALRAAQDLVRTSRSHPVYWAAFILIGDTGPLSPAVRRCTSRVPE